MSGSKALKQVVETVQEEVHSLKVPRGRRRCLCLAWKISVAIEDGTKSMMDSDGRLVLIGC